jgi:hypothetical protein
MRFAPNLAVLLAFASFACGGAEPVAPSAPEPHHHSRPLSAVAPNTPRAWGPPHSTGPTFDDALNAPEDTAAVANEPTLSDVDLAGPMKQPSFLGDCNVPDSMHVKVQVAIRDGAPIGATVRTDPDDPAVADCVDKAVRALTWPPSKRRDSLTTEY